MLNGIATLTCVLLTYSSGNSTPDKTTLVEPSCGGNGTPVSPSDPSARPLPKIETSNPSAGALAKSALLTMPPFETTGTVGFDNTWPLTSTLPVNGNCCASARTVNPAELFCGTQVPAQLPLPIASMPRGGSPSLKLTITDPVLRAFPQSSTTWTTMGVGHAAGVLKPVPMVVKTGRSFDAVHAAVACGVTANGSGVSLIKLFELVAGRAEPEVAEITRRSCTVCELPSPNKNLIDP